jgi:hypothetical protein
MSYTVGHPHPYNMGLGTVAALPEAGPMISSATEQATEAVRKTPPWVLPLIGLVIMLTLRKNLGRRR